MSIKKHITQVNIPEYEHFSGMVGFRCVKNCGNINLYDDGFDQELDLISKTIFPEKLKPANCYWRWLRLEIYDRFGFLDNKAKPIIRYTDWLDLRTEKTFVELCVNRALQISCYNRIYVMLSGGIDSLCALSSLILAGLSKKIIVLYGGKNPENADILIPWLSEHKIRVIRFDDDVAGNTRNDVLDSSDDSYIIVTGEGSDQLDPGLLSYTEDRFCDYKSYWKSEFIENWVSNFPIECVTVGDVSWLANFAIRYTQYSWIHSFFMQNIPPYKQFSFYCGSEFTAWILTNYDNVLRNNPLSEQGKHYKALFKDVIRLVFGALFDEYSKLYSFRRIIGSQSHTMINGKGSLATDGIHLYRYNCKCANFTLIDHDYN